MTLALALRVTALLVAGLLAGRLLGRASAATRHAVRRLVVLMALALPVLAPFVPAWTVIPHLDSAAVATFGPLGAVDRRPGVAPARWALPGPAEPPRDLARRVWLWGVGVVVAYRAGGHMVLWRLRRRSRRAEGRWPALAARVAARMNVDDVPEVRVAPVSGPLVAGLVRAVVLIPPSAEHWAATRCEATLLHELAHVRRGDLRAQAAAHLLCALHWFNPLAWLTARAMRRDQEWSCDDEVLERGWTGTDYAAELLAIAMATRGAPRATPALPMARASDIEGRIVSMLGARPRRMSRAARLAVPAGVFVVTVAVAGASAQPGPAPSRGVAAPGPLAWMAGAMSGPHEPAGTLADASDAAARERRTLRLALTPGDQVVPALVEALADPASAVRQKAAVGLAWRRHPDVVPVLLEAAADTDARVREKVIVALALSGDARARRAVVAARTDPDPAVRDKAGKLAALP